MNDAIETITLDITFRGPFHVGGTGPASGLDRVLDRGALLPGSSLKGLMRAEAHERLHASDSILAAVFGGGGGAGSPWWWSDAHLHNAEFDRAARIVIDDETGTTKRGFLQLGEEVWCRRATCTVEPLTGLTQGREPTAGHRLLIRAAARCVSALGGGRTRGSGWVTVTEPGVDWTEADTVALREVLRS